MAARFNFVARLGRNQAPVFTQTAFSSSSLSTCSRRVELGFCRKAIAGQKRGFLTTCSCAGLESVLQDHPAFQYVPLMGPSVRNLLELYHLENVQIQASGHKGQLLKGDVLKYIKENETVPRIFTLETTKVDVPSPTIHTIYMDSSDTGYIDIQTAGIGRSGIRQSKTDAPHIYTTMQCNLDQVLAMQNKLKQDNIDITLNDFIIKAASVSLRCVPEVNSCCDEDGCAMVFDAVNVAVALPSPYGLTAPVLKTANELDIQTLALKIKDLTERAKTDQLNDHELQGGTFTIANLGSFGVKHFGAVLYPQQSGVLGIGEPWTNISEDGSTTTSMTVTLSCDGRVVDESNASTWLTEFKRLIENPLQIGL